MGHWIWNDRRRDNRVKLPLDLEFASGRYQGGGVHALSILCLSIVFGYVWYVKSLCYPRIPPLYWDFLTVKLFFYFPCFRITATPHNSAFDKPHTTPTSHTLKGRCFKYNFSVDGGTLWIFEI